MIDTRKTIDQKTTSELLALDATRAKQLNYPSDWTEQYQSDRRAICAELERRKARAYADPTACEPSELFT